MHDDDDNNDARRRRTTTNNDVNQRTTTDDGGGGGGGGGGSNRPAPCACAHTCRPWFDRRVSPMDLRNRRSLASRAMLLAGIDDDDDRDISHSTTPPPSANTDGSGNAPRQPMSGGAGLSVGATLCMPMHQHTYTPPPTRMDGHLCAVCACMNTCGDIGPRLGCGASAAAPWCNQWQRR